MKGSLLETFSYYKLIIARAIKIGPIFQLDINNDFISMTLHKRFTLKVASIVMTWSNWITDMLTC